MSAANNIGWTLKAWQRQLSYLEHKHEMMQNSLKRLDKMSEVTAEEQREFVRSCLESGIRPLEMLLEIYRNQIFEIEEDKKASDFSPEIFALNLAKEIENYKFIGKGATFAPYSYATAVAPYYRDLVGETFKAVGKAMQDCRRLNSQAFFGRDEGEDPHVLYDHSVGWWEKEWGKNWIEKAIELGKGRI